MDAERDPLTPILEAQPVVLLDGGMGSELGFRGHDLSDVLWSARLLLDEPRAIRDVHWDYLEAGADVVTTASYQVSYEGFERRGISRRDVDALLGRSVALAQEARDSWWSHSRPGRVRPLVAASVGPYGAARGDGSEYVGRYGLSVRALAEWHRPRWEALAVAGADLLACETLPCIEEAEALLGLLAEEPRLRAWVSFSCRDEAHVSQGEPFVDAVILCATSPQVVAVGLNCVKPRYVPSLLEAVRGVAEAAGRPLLAYPNSSEIWDPVARAFRPGDSDELDFASQGPRWRDAGARLIGGCCRIRPAHIRQLRDHLLGHLASPESVAPGERDSGTTDRGGAS